jgi:hypothetical protein
MPGTDRKAQLRLTRGLACLTQQQSSLTSELGAELGLALDRLKEKADPVSSDVLPIDSPKCWLRIVERPSSPARLSVERLIV